MANDDTMVYVRGDHMGLVFSLHAEPLLIREASLFGFRQLTVAETRGRAGVKEGEAARKPIVGAVDDQNWSKSLVKNAIFAPFEMNGRVDGNQKKASLKD